MTRFIALFLISVCAIGCEGSRPSGPVHTTSDSVQEIGLVVVRDESSLKVSFSISHPNPLDVCHWDFGDGQSEVTDTPSVSHVYDEPGVYTVRLTIGSEIFEERVEVLGPLSFQFMQNAVSPGLISFISNERDASGAEWDLGDGTRVETSGFGITHRYTSPGTYLVTLTIGDRQAQVTIIISQLTPGIGITYTQAMPRTVGFLAVSSLPGPYTWEFGDGTVTETDNLTVQHAFPPTERETVFTVTLFSSSGEKIAETFVHLP